MWVYLALPGQETDCHMPGVQIHSPAPGPVSINKKGDGESAAGVPGMVSRPGPDAAPFHGCLARRCLHVVLQVTPVFPGFPIFFSTGRPPQSRGHRMKFFVDRHRCFPCLPAKFLNRLWLGLLLRSFPSCHNAYWVSCHYKSFYTLGTYSQSSGGAILTRGSKTQDQEERR